MLLLTGSIFFTCLIACSLCLWAASPQQSACILDHSHTHQWKRIGGGKSFREFLRNYSVQYAVAVGTVVKFGSIQKNLGDTRGFLSDQTVKLTLRLTEEQRSSVGHFRVPHNQLRRAQVLTLESLTQMVWWGEFLVICILRFTPNESDVGGPHRWRDIKPTGNTISKLGVQSDILCACKCFQTAHKQASIANKEIEEQCG